MSEPRSYGAAVGVIIVAAGRGERLGAGPPKALRLLGGAPILVHAARAFAGLVEVICIVVPSGAEDRIRALVAGEPLGVVVPVVAGAPTRQGSVDVGLRALPAEVGVVLVHDAARPFVPADVVRSVVEAVRSGDDAVIPVLPVTDTIKQVDAEGVVVATPDRAALRAVQTPQGFRREVLVAAHRAASADDATDDASLVERLGGRVRTVPGSAQSFKITSPADLEQAERLLAVRAADTDG